VQALVALLPLQLREGLGLLGTRSEDHKSVEEREFFFQTYTAFINEFALVTHSHIQPITARVNSTSNQSQQE